jgi:oligopeptide/dipeptide ABC transporter ATP-binding protein
VSVVHATFGREDPILEVRDLDVAFGPKDKLRHVVRGIDFTLHRGETLGLVGESGAGKTIAVRALMHLLPQTATVSGSIRFEGRELMGLSERELRPYRGNELAMIFQDPMRALNPTMRIGRQITEGLRGNLHLSRRQAKARALELLERVRLPDPLRRYDEVPRQLNALTRQKILIAIAISCAPKILVADEPTTRLDAQSREEVMALLLDAQRELGAGLLLVTHDVELVASHTDRLVVLCGGQVLERARTKAVMSAPRVPYTHLLLRSSPLLVRPTDTPEATPYESIAPPRSQVWLRPVPMPRRRPMPLHPAIAPGCPFVERCSSGQAHCREAIPPLKEYEYGHEWACWFPLPAPAVRDH